KKMNETVRFKPNNILNIEKTNLDTAVYRIFRFEDILELFNNKEITLVKANLWEDPYENFILKCNATHNGEKIGIDKIQSQIFGQCWSLQSESDAMWRIYSPNYNGIKIKSSLEKIFNIIFDDNEKTSLVTSFVGKVDYKNKKEFNDYFSNSENTSLLGTSNLVINSHLLKRKEFEHEKEVRLIYFIDSFSGELNNKIKKFKVDPNDLIDEICFDPRIDKRYLELYKKTFKNLGFNGNMIKSDLYDFKGVDIEI
ncbi:DUF2971 domain-containing protein, partial [Tenacibaculum dicentrarchi]|uniref:DUF2971 domain-containing protein n=1 Tax=Tenacibaculum dicentrarchi TaxID=669041 RepID=UPI003512FA85